MSGVILGGIESFVLTMNRHLKEEDIFFDYVFLDKDELIHGDTIASMGGRVLFLPYYVRQPFAYVVRLYRMLKEEKGNVDAVYVNLFSLVHILPVVVARLLGMKVVVHAHNNNIQHQNPLYRALNSLGKQVCGCFRCLRLSNSEASTHFMFPRKRWAETQVIYNAIDVDRYAFRPDVREAQRKALGVEGKYVVGFSGRLALQKNPLFLIDIFKAFHQNHPDSVLLVVGEGPLEEQVKAHVPAALQKAVHFLGRRSDMPEMYQSMDLFLLPSLFEGLGIVLVEAQAAGLPCLTSAGVVPDLVNVTDLLRRANLKAQPEAWAKEMTEMRRQQKGLRETYCEQVKATHFNIHFEAHRFAQRLRRFIEDCPDV